MRKVAAKFVPKLLTFGTNFRLNENLFRQDLRLDAAQAMLNCANQDSQFLKKIITGDETWVYGYDPETKSSRLNENHLHHQDRKRRAKFRAR